MNEERVADFFSQPSDENFDQLRIVFVRVLPNTFAQFSAREDAAWLAHEHLQQHQLAGAQVDSPRPAICLVIRHIECKIADAKGKRRFVFEFPSVRC
jgi:hypothetical protein